MTTGEPERRERRFDHARIEPKWQDAWDDADTFRLEDDVEDPAYVLAMFPYTSGSLHMGHVRVYTITDAFARFRRMQGEAVLHPMGWDSFGLPAENAAEERETDPREWTMECIESMREQLNAMGFGYDWEREVTTCEPEYYQWNQWLFQRFREAGLVERQAAELNWCPSCETVLADEQVEEAETPAESRGGGEAAGAVAGAEEVCWRCETPIEHREMDQWFLTITDYAEELLEALDDLEGWPANVREMQRNWIGRQEGDSVAFEVPGHGDVEIFTTRLDTIHGATYFALSPGHWLAQELAAADDDVAAYVERAEAAEEDELDQTSGVFTGEHAINPATGEEIPIYVADYVLSDVGTGALYAVPGHDERDHAFAEEHGLPIEQVIEPAPDAVGREASDEPSVADAPEDAETDPDDVDVQEAAYTPDGQLGNSGEFDGLTSEAARERFVEEFDGEHRVEYRLRDWGISRQRYWGTPIPMIDCPDCGHVPVPEADLPVELPEFVHTTGNPLDAAEDWKRVECPACGGDAERETDTMDTFVDSSWYFLRFVSPDLEDAPFDGEQASDWLPVDQYVGGIEHAVMHLLYARFFTKVLDDLDLLQGVREPFADLTNQGMVLGEDGNKMSKSRGNGVSPQRIVDEYGADTARLFIMEAAQPEKDFAWSAEDVASAHDFLQSCYELADAFADGAVATSDGVATEVGSEGVTAEVSDQPGTAAAYVDRQIEATAARATDEFEAFRFNHAIQAARELVSLLRRYREHAEPDAETFERGLRTAAKLLAPVAPHVTEEIWSALGRDGLLAEAEWPAADPPADHEIEQRLVESTREDVREIVDVVGIDDPQRIEIAVAPDWKHRVLDLAREADGDVVGAVMQDEALRQRGEAAADFAKELAGEGHVDEQLPPERERAALERAAWLIEREFDAEVEVLDADAADAALRAKAEPGRPAIEIEE